MNMKRTVASCMILVFFLIPPLVFGQEERGEYIANLFKAAVSEEPKMAWLVPPDIIIAEEKFQDIFLYTNAREVPKAGFMKTFARKEITAIRKKHMIACEYVVGDKFRTYYRYRLSKRTAEPFGYPERVFYTSRSLPGGVTAGYTYSSLDGKGIEAVLERLSLSGKQFLHKQFIVRPRGAKQFYSFHGFYDKDSGEIFKEAIVLHDKNGKILASMVQDISDDTLCDGCPRPVYRNDNPDATPVDMTESFVLLNAFTLPRFAYPVLMLENITVEGRGISLVTFDPKGRYSEYLVYEYVVECQSDYSPEDRLPRLFE